ncbi:MAG: HAD family hydrolase [Nitrososphaerota archaeon]|nr:HAD family hydrolase [Nitrososphaerota archaeon]
MQASLGNISTRSFWNGICNDYSKAQEKYLDSQLRLDSQFTPIAEELKKEYDLAILSNDVSEWSAYLRQKYDLNRFFKSIIISSDWGYRKPDSRSYRILLDSLKVPPSTCFFVDDSPRNLQTAAELGMKTIGFQKQKTKSSFQPHYSIKSLDELLQIFKAH